MNAEQGYTKAHAALQALEAEQRDRYRPARTQEPRTPLERYAAALEAARSQPALTIDCGWLA